MSGVHVCSLCLICHSKLKEPKPTVNLSLSCMIYSLCVSCGAYSCTGNVFISSNSYAFVDPPPTCEVTTSRPIIRGQYVTLTCRMTYYHKSQEARLSPGAGISASLSWESAAGTLLSNSSRSETNAAGKVIGETLEVSVTTLASGPEVPSYNCTLLLQFTNETDGNVIYATNSLEWRCPSAPVPTSSKYTV